jgi:hypothetical protein
MKIIISENQVDKIKSKIHEYVKKYGFEKCREIFGDKVLLTIGFNNDPMEFLNLYNDLDVVQSEIDPNWTLFRYEKDKNLLLYNKSTNIIYSDYSEFGLTLKRFGLSFDEIKELMITWITDIGNLIQKPIKSIPLMMWMRVTT